MSDNVQSQGYFGKLKVPCAASDSKVWDILSEKLEEHDLYLNYDGTMIYSDERSNSYDGGLLFAKPNGAVEFRDKCAKAGYEVDPVKYYTCVWYNGADSSMSTAKLDEVFA
jgi:hypothetical protein